MRPSWGAGEGDENGNKWSLASLLFSIGFPLNLRRDLLPETTSFVLHFLKRGGKRFWAIVFSRYGNTMAFAVVKDTG